VTPVRKGRKPTEAHNEWKQYQSTHQHQCESHTDMNSMNWVNMTSFSVQQSLSPCWRYSMLQNRIIINFVRMLANSSVEYCISQNILPLLLHWPANNLGNKCTWCGFYGQCTDTSDLRHFGPKTLRHHVFGAEVSQIFCTGAEVSIGHFVTSAEMSQTLRH